MADCCAPVHVAVLGSPAVSADPISLASTGRNNRFDTPPIPSSKLDQMIYKDLLIAEQRFVEAISCNSPNDFALPWDQLLRRVEEASKQGLLRVGTMQLCQAVNTKVAAVATLLADIEQFTARVHRRVDSDSRSILSAPDAFDLRLPPTPPRTSSPSGSSPSSSPRPSRAAAPTLPSALTGAPAPTTPIDPHQPYRAFFLAHFAHPYPSPADLAALSRAHNLLLPPHSPSTAANAGLRPTEPKQVRTWFINSRRRSGWAQFFKTHCHSSRPALEELLEREKAGETLEFNVAEDLAEVRRYLDRADEGVREGLSELMAATTLGGGLGKAATAVGASGVAAGAAAERRKARDEAQAALGLGRIVESPVEEKLEAREDYLAVPPGGYRDRVVSNSSTGTTNTRHSSGSSLLSYESAVSNPLSLATTADTSNPDYLTDLSLSTTVPAPLPHPSFPITPSSIAPAPALAPAYATQPSHRSSARVPYESTQSFIYVSKPETASPPAPVEPNPYFATIDELGMDFGLGEEWGVGGDWQV